jgi:beta-xylosidase
MKAFCTILLLASFSVSLAQNVSRVWGADNGNGTFKNPVIHADYSDPDAIRVGDDYYMISSSFNHVPGLPILHSNDLVNWELVGHALLKQPPYDHFSKVRHGAGVWAPSIRYHHNEFYIYYPDPDFGIYLVKAKNIHGPWTIPILVEEGKGLIDPCPLWDDNGNVYLVHAFAGSRAGIKSVIVVKEMNKEGTRVISDGVMVYDGHEKDPTIEGPKFYKRNGWYYIFAPAGGVSTGWQTVLRSKNIYGPYDRKVVMTQGNTTVNGPHQGAWVDTKTGENWFLHFQDKGAYGRVIHLQPLKWVNDWPVIGEDKDGDGTGEPVMICKKPAVGKIFPVQTVAETDEFSSASMGLQWQWQANPGFSWAFPTPAFPEYDYETGGTLTLVAQPLPDSTVNYWNAPHLLLQKFPAEEFMATAKLAFTPGREGERTGLIIFGTDYAYVSLVKKTTGNYISFGICRDADKGRAESLSDGEKINSPVIYFRVKVLKGANCDFFYSEDGKSFKKIGETLVAKPGRWVGAKMGLFCTGAGKTNDAGFVKADWFRVEALVP